MFFLFQSRILLSDQSSCYLWSILIQLNMVVVFMLTKTWRQTQACPKQADARLWYDYCFMRYDTVNFVGQSDTGFLTILYNVQNATDPDAFDKVVRKLVNKANSDVVSAGSGSLGREKASFTEYITIYALAQCTRDLQPLDCAQCLSSTLQYFPIYCSHRQGCRILYTSCMVRYEIYPFYFPLDGNAKNSGVDKYTKAILHPH
jgi:hypothetical protein